MAFNLPYTIVLEDYIVDPSLEFQFYERINYDYQIYSYNDLADIFLEIFNDIKKNEKYFYSKSFEDYCNGLISYYETINEKIISCKSEEITQINELLQTYDELIEYVKKELQRYYTYTKGHILEPFNEKEKGVNVPFKIAMLDELNILGMLKSKYQNKTDIYRIIQFIVGGNIDNIKDYYNSIYGNYSGNNQIDPDHRAKAKEIYFK